MIRHLVMWTLQENAGGLPALENAKKMKAMLEGLNGKIPGLTHLEVSHEIVGADPECHVVLCSEHGSEADLDVYQKHPLHQECVAFVKTVVSSRRVLDYRI